MLRNWLMNKLILRILGCGVLVRTCVNRDRMTHLRSAWHRLSGALEERKMAGVGPSAKRARTPAGRTSRPSKKHKLAAATAQRAELPQPDKSPTLGSTAMPLPHRLWSKPLL